MAYILIGIIGSMPILAKINKKTKEKVSYNVISNIYTFGVFALSVCFLLVATYNPFIYFRF